MIVSPSIVVPRTAAPLERAQDGTWQRRPSRPIADFRPQRAYVLLGDPGSGKTTTFEEEAKACPDDSLYITARRFLWRDLDRHQERRTKTLFIDGLDEARAGHSNRRQPLDAILKCLELLDYPPVRISCRITDWLTSDQREFAEEYSDLQILLLDPLTTSDTYQIIEAEGHSVDTVVTAARDGGIDHFLANPLLLKLLITGHTETEAARSKAAVLEDACQEMAREHNPAHQEAEPDLSATDSTDIVGAAGQLSALLLLTRKAFVSFHRSAARDPDDCLFLEDVQGDRTVARRSLRSKLFSGVAPGQMAPVHPIVADYLAGRYLNDQVINGQEGLPASRVLALICGPDNQVVPTLRGVAAWLAVFVPAVRRRLIKSDPWGVLAYADPSQLFDHDKELLLTCLAKQNDMTMDFWDLSDMAVAGLVGPATIRIVRRYIATPDYSEAAQDAMALLFRGIATRHANQHDMTVEELLDVGSEPHWSSRVRYTALMAAVATARRSNTTRPLLRVLEDIRSGKIPDPDNQLRGLLLQEMYPNTIAPEKIWNYVPESTGTGASGVNELFWHRLAEPDQSAPEDVAALLDGIVEQRNRRDFDLGYLARTAWKLLERGIHLHGDQMPVGRMYDWIKAVAWERHSGDWCPASDEVLDVDAGGAMAFRTLSIQPWLAERPATQLTLLEEFCRRWSADNWWWQWMSFEQMVCGRAYPADYLGWCLEQALHMALDKPDIAQLLVERAAASGWHRIASHKSLGPLVETVCTHPVLANCVQEIRAREEHPRDAVERQRDRRRPRDRQLADNLHSQAEALLKGSAPPKLLDQLAQAYLGIGQYSGLRNPVQSVEDYLREWPAEGLPRGHDLSGPMDRVKQALARDEDAAAIAVRGLRVVLNRQDLPSSRLVLEFDENNRRHWLVYPLLAATAEAHARGEDICERSSDWIARSLVCYALTPLENRQQPAWIDKLLTCRPEAVADALVVAGKSQIRRDVWDGGHLECLATDDRYARVAAETALRLARTLPSRCNGSQAGALQTVLGVALRCGAGTRDLTNQILELTDSKSVLAGMDVKQMATWLGVGLCLEFDKYIATVIEFLDDGEIARLWHLVEFLVCLDDDGLGWPESQDVQTLGALVQAVASRCTRWSWTQRDVPSGTTLGVSTQDLAEQAAEKLVDTWTGILARTPDVAAGDALKALADNPRLASWQHVVEPKYSKWRIVRRVAEYEIPHLRDVQQTLGGGPPANPGDFAALLVDKLEELADEIRNGNTDDWKQYWNVNRYGQPTKPRPEDPCRDALLSDLRQRLPTGVNADPEGHYAEDKRADIRVAYENRAIPVEIKKNSHRQLWSSIETQLIAKYTRDPGASGFGIYLVLWFDAEDTRAVPPCGHHSKPSNPAELKRCLEEALTDDQRRMISVVVVDVSRPDLGKSP